MKVIILGGFLGSGKTTALMQLARYLAGASDPKREYKVVILENEVGEVGIDDQFLRGGGFTVNNLFAGCACCTVSGELITSVKRIADEMDPEWLIVETTGIAYPGLMRDNLKGALNLESRVCVLADAQRWKRLLVPLENLIRGQIECADAVIINKIDLSTEESLQSIERDILGFGKNVPIVRISALDEIQQEVWHLITGTQQ